MKQKELRELQTQLTGRRTCYSRLVVVKLVDYIDKLKQRVRQLEKNRVVQCTQCGGYVLLFSEGAVECHCESTDEGAVECPCESINEASDPDKVSIFQDALLYIAEYDCDCWTDPENGIKDICQKCVADNALDEVVKKG